MSFFSKPSAGGGAATNFEHNEVPGGLINGANVTYSLANSPLAGTLHLYVNGIHQKEGGGDDFTVAGATVTMSIAPFGGSLLLATYEK